MCPFIGSTVSPEQLATMTEAFDSHCLEHGIVDETDRNNTALLVMRLFEGGTNSVEELKAELNRHRPCLINGLSDKPDKTRATDERSEDEFDRAPVILRC